MGATSRQLVALLLLLPAAAAAAPPTPTAAEQRVVEASRQLLAELVAVDTVQGHETSALRPILRRLRAAGIQAQLLESSPGRGNLIARVPGNGRRRPLLLLAHIDVVTVTRQPWTVPPFRVTERDGFMYGRGVVDDKGMAAAVVAIALEAHRSEARLSRDLIVALTAGEEEGGSAGVGWLVEHHPELLDAEIGLNEGGGGAIILSDDGSHVQEVDIGLGQKTYQSYRVAAHGRGGYSFLPRPGSDPVQTLAVALQRIGALAFPPRVLPATRPAIAALANGAEPALAAALRRAAATGAISPADDAVLSRDPIANAYIRTTCVVTMLQASPQENVLPDSAEATVQCRLLPGDSPEHVHEALRRAAGDAGVEITPAGRFSAGVPMSPEGEVPDAIRRVSRRFWGELPVVPGFAPGSDDGRFLTARGVRVYGAHPSIASNQEDRLGFLGHGADERVPIRWYAEGVRWLDALVVELAR